MIYFDHSASTPPYAEVIETVAEVMKLHYGNPSSLHRAGVEAEKLIERARAVIGKALQVKPGELIFTSGATESNNLAIKGAAMQYAGRGNHFVTTQVEHASVYECFRQLEEQGCKVTYLPVDRNGIVSVDRVREALTDETVLVSVMHVNNEVGSVQPIADIGALLKRYPRILFHVDGVQSVGKLPLSIREWGIDLFSLSAHKLRGPKGAGLLYCREGVRLTPLLSGGAQEHGMRAGTQNVPNIVGMAKAIRMTIESRPETAAHLYKLRDRLIEAIGQMPQLTVNGDSESSPQTAPHIVNVSFPGMKPEVVLHMLEQRGIIASTQSACSSKTGKPSRVLTAMGVGELCAASGIRFSLAAEHTEEDIDILASSLRQVTDELGRIGRKLPHGS